MPMDELAIDAAHLARRYGRRWALADVSLQLPRGRVLLVAGRNGSGKTTLLRILATATRADAGRATVAGHDLSQKNEIRRVTALLAHQSYLYESLTASENLEIVAFSVWRRRSRLRRQDCLRHTETALERVGLADRADDPVST